MPKLLHAAKRFLAGSRLFGAVAGLLLCGAGSVAFAEDTLKITPAVSAREMYDSNVYMMGKGDLEHSLAPSLKVELEQERVRGYVSGLATLYRYSSLSAYDRMDQKYDAFVEMNATERVRVSVTAEAVVDHTFSSTLENTGQIAQLTLREVYGAQPSITFDVTERNTATLFGGYTQTRYGSTIYADSNTTNYGGRWGYQFTERTQAIAQVSQTRIEQSSAHQSVLSTLGGFEYKLTELLKLRLLGGMSSMQSTNAQGQDSSRNGFSADTGVEWRVDETSSVSASYNRDMTSGLNGEDIVRNRYSIFGAKRITEKLQLMLNGNMVMSKISAGSTGTTSTTRWMEISPQAQYQVFEHGTLALGYGYGAQKVEETGVTKERNQVFLNFSISFP
ncbi:MAG TPA: hypothetical protein VN419_10945 [Humidesulfovibrio sp.]|uniref:hypothetical protein n=1 Tax=Humidesulfovibrio sp. TaxID=2910988 RepID=UPI002BD886AE|nr:hypothetical protein [Humidesulfovibrio sp.]HWR04524.1 hypothetical protein [Humidesulfovibrio sp.]